MLQCDFFCDTQGRYLAIQFVLLIYALTGTSFGDAYAAYNFVTICDAYNLYSNTIPSQSVQIIIITLLLIIIIITLLIIIVIAIQL